MARTVRGRRGPRGDSQAAPWPLLESSPGSAWAIVLESLSPLTRVYQQEKGTLKAGGFLVAEPVHTYVLDLLHEGGTKMQVRTFLDRDQRQGGEREKQERKKEKKRRWSKNRASIKVGTTGSKCVAFAFRGAGLSALQTWKQFLQSMSPRVRLPTLCFASAKNIHTHSLSMLVAGRHVLFLPSTSSGQRPNKSIAHSATVY